MKVNYIIVDDEPIAHRVIEEYCKDLSFMQLKANCYNALQAISFLNENRTDLIFLDINMPKLKGFDFLRTLENPPHVIVTSAYQEYALEGFDLNVTDYLLKPFSLERFIKAINKVLESRIPAAEHVQAPNRVTGAGSLFIKGEKKYHQVILNDIIYIEASGNYSTVYLKNGEIMTSEKISDLEKKLGSEEFVRVHKSFIVSLSKITEIEGNLIRLGSRRVPVGRVFKSNLDRYIKGISSGPGN